MLDDKPGIEIMELPFWAGPIPLCAMRKYDINVNTRIGMKVFWMWPERDPCLPGPMPAQTGNPVVRMGYGSSPANRVIFLRLMQNAAPSLETPRLSAPGGYCSLFF